MQQRQQHSATRDSTLKIFSRLQVDIGEQDQQGFRLLQVCRDILNALLRTVRRAQKPQVLLRLLFKSVLLRDCVVLVDTYLVEEDPQPAKL